MKAKKLAALGLASALSLSLASPAFAASTNKTTKITGTYQEIAIDVTVPTTGTATINPYGLPVKVQSTETTGTKKTLVTISGQKITTMPMAIYSKTEVGLLVGATVTGEIKGENLKLATATIPDGATTNTALIYLETKASKREETNLADANSTTKVGPFEAWDATANNNAGDVVSDVVNELNTWKATTYTDARNQILVGTTAKTKNGIGYLTAGDKDNNNALKSGGAMWFRLAGDVVANPKTAWTKSDGVTVTVAFTFTPTDSAGNPGTLKASGNLATAAESTGVTVSVDQTNATTNPFMTFGADAKYKWTLVSSPDGSAAAIANEETDTVTLTGYDKTGDYVLKLTVTENNVPYVSTITLNAAS